MTFFWSGHNAEIRCLGNVFSYYFAMLGVTSLVFSFRHPQFGRALMFAIGWAVCYFPFFLVPRVMYQYHYCIPLMIGTMAFGAGMDIFLPQKLKGTLTVVFIGLTIFGFRLWSPYVYGTQKHDKAIALWSRLWIDGDRRHASMRQAHLLSKRGE
jgi:dolichyl-phosphate-mannose--protein O-mannosyl transferase